MGFTPGFTWPLLCPSASCASLRGDSSRQHQQLQGEHLTWDFTGSSAPCRMQGIEFRVLPTAHTLAGPGRTWQGSQNTPLSASFIHSLTGPPPTLWSRSGVPEKPTCSVSGYLKLRVKLTSVSTKRVLSSFQQLYFYRDRTDHCKTVAFI